MAGSPASVEIGWNLSDLLQGLKVFGTYVAVVIFSTSPCSLPIYLLPSTLSIPTLLFPIAL